MKDQLQSVRRSRWAAIGAAVAVTIGGGGVFVASAATTSAPSSVVTIEPVRVLDTRDPVNVGLPGPFVSSVSQKLKITGSIATTAGTAIVVPAGATGVLLNVTAVSPSADGFISIRPGDATGAPKTSSLNFSMNETAPNSVQVALPTTGTNAGQIDITFDALGKPGPTSDILVDVVGYLVVGTGAAGPAGPAGPVGPVGPVGPPAVTTVATFGGAWTATNASVSITPDGVEFGPYVDGGSAGGSVFYNGLNGQPLSSVESLAFYMRYVATGTTGGVGVPYLRIFTDDGLGGENSSIFSPNTQSPDPVVTEGPFNEWVATSGSWRFNDDGGNFPDISYASLIAGHGTELITGIYISTGFSTGTDLAALLRWVEINGQRFSFAG